MNFKPDIFKRFHLILGLGVLLLGISGCEKHPYEEEDIPVTGKTIEFFALSSSANTRAAAGHPIDGEEFPNNQSFGIYAYQIGFSGNGTVELFKDPFNNTSPVAFNNKKVTKDNTGTISYTPKVGWPDLDGDKSLRFFAYYPYGHTNVSVNQASETEQVDLTYTLPDDPSKHVDLMYWMSPRIESVANPVTVGFGHALTRLCFEAKIPATGSFPAGTSVQITRIELTNPVGKGILHVTPNGNAVNAAWSLNDEVKTPLILTPANGLNSDLIPVDDTYRNLLDTDGDLLVIPQDISGLSLKVTAVINGISREYTYDLEDTAPNVQWEMNEIVTYRFTFGWNGISLSASVKGWDYATNYVILDGQYYLKTSQTRVDLGANGGTAQVTFETNYDGITGGDAAGLRLDKTGTADWCTVTMGTNVGQPGTDRRNISVQAEPTLTDRNTQFNVCAGNMVYVVKVAQKASPWLTFTPSKTAGFPINGECHYFELQSSSGSPWTIKSVSDPYGILLPEISWVGATGSTPGQRFNFFLKASAVAGQAATLTVGGGDSDMTYTLKAVAPVAP